MGLFDWFKRPAPIAGRADLVDFLDTRAAYLVQKSIYDFAHACAGMAFDRLMREAEFVEAMDRSRWRSYPLGLALIAETVHGVLRPAADGMPLAEALREAAFDAFDRYPIPAMLDAEIWVGERAELGQRVLGIALHAPKAVKDIPFGVSEQLYNNLPIHAKIRGDDREIVINHLRTNLIRIYDDFSRRADVEGLVLELGVAEKADAENAAAG
ncbi:MAG TPA: hypothetical protein VH765_02175 [Xanthobacteraceae bacterium]|jgi:hypothetical protein